MGDTEYTDGRLQDIFQRFDEKLDSIHDQTKLTNGRVTNLERWQNRIVGGMIVITTLVLPIVLRIIVDYLSG